MGFDEILDRKHAIERVGEVHFRFEPSLLVGETPARHTWGPELLGIAAVGFGLGALADLLTGGGIASGGVLVFSTGIATWAGVALRTSSRVPHRFSLSFADETLRLEERPRPWRRARVRVVPFDSVDDLRVVHAKANRFALELVLDESALAPKARPGRFRWRGRKPGPTTRILVDRVPPSEVESLRKLWRMLRNALGL